MSTSLMAATTTHATDNLAPQHARGAQRRTEDKIKAAYHNESMGMRQRPDRHLSSCWALPTGALAASPMEGVTGMMAWLSHVPGSPQGGLDRPANIEFSFRVTATVATSQLRAPRPGVAPLMR